MDVGRVGHGSQLLGDDRLSPCPYLFQTHSVRPILANRTGDIQASVRNSSLISIKRGALTFANVKETIILLSGGTYVK